MKKEINHFLQLLQLILVVNVNLSINFNDYFLAQTEIIKHSEKEKVYFFCGLSYDRQTLNSQLTLMVRNLTGDVIRIVKWRGKYGEEVCEIVAQRFNRLYRESKLNYLIQGNYNNYIVICGVENIEETCNSPDQILIYLSSQEDPEMVIYRLRSSLDGRNSNHIILDALSPELYGNPITDAPEPEPIEENEEEEES
ncbi:MAG: COP23 domain-containing protein [Crocosphaera sp.]